MNNSKLLKILALPMLFVLLTFGVKAQEVPTQDLPEVNEDFTDEDYEKFVKINMEAIPIQQQAEGEMVEIITEKGLDVERFQELAQAQQAGTITDASEDPEEINKFNMAGQEVLEVQKKVQEEIKQKIVDNEMDVQKFQQIAMAYNQSETVREKIDQLLQAQQPDEAPEE